MTHCIIDYCNEINEKVSFVLFKTGFDKEIGEKVDTGIYIILAKMFLLKKMHFLVS